MAKTESSLETSFYLSKWLITDADKPAFEASDICGLTGISSQTLQNWANRGIVTPTPSKKGKGGIRRYDKIDACTIKIARGLTILGLEASGASLVAKNAILALVHRVADKQVSDTAFVAMTACVFVDPLNRQEALIISTEGDKINLDEARRMRLANETLFISIGKHLWELYKAEAALYNENQKHIVAEHSGKRVAS